MSARHQSLHHLSDLDLIVAVQKKAAFAEAEIEAAYRFRDGSDVREWHLERADKATVELLGLINGPQYRGVWQRMAEAVAPLHLSEADVPSFLRPSHGGGLS